MNHGQQRNKNEEARKSKKMINKDTPRGDDATQKASHHDEPRPYRPDENVDNQKSPGARSEPGHNTSGKAAPIPGAQVVKAERVHDIDQQSEGSGSFTPATFNGSSIVRRNLLKAICYRWLFLMLLCIFFQIQ